MNKVVKKLSTREILSEKRPELNAAATSADMFVVGDMAGGVASLGPEPNPDFPKTGQ